MQKAAYDHDNDWDFMPFGAETNTEMHQASEKEAVNYIINEGETVAQRIPVYFFYLPIIKDFYHRLTHTISNLRKICSFRQLNSPTHSVQQATLRTSHITRLQQLRLAYNLIARGEINQSEFPCKEDRGREKWNNVLNFQEQYNT